LPRRSLTSLFGRRPASMIHRFRPSIRSAALLVTTLFAAVVPAPPARADSLDTAKNAVVSLRDGTSCAPLRDNPLVEQAADVVNRSTDDYLDHTATRIPIEDPLPGLKDLGYGGSKAIALFGSHSNPADALKGALLEGYAAIPDCSYTDFGLSMLRNKSTGYMLVTIVLAGG
jgi:hypothetical protein